MGEKVDVKWARIRIRDRFSDRSPVGDASAIRGDGGPGRPTEPTESESDLLRLAAGLRFPQLMRFAIALRLPPACRRDAEMAQLPPDASRRKHGRPLLFVYDERGLSYNQRAPIMV